MAYKDVLKYPPSIPPVELQFQPAGSGRVVELVDTTDLKSVDH